MRTFIAICLSCGLVFAQDSKQLVLDALQVDVPPLPDNGVMITRDKGNAIYERYEFRNQGAHSLFVMTAEDRGRQSKNVSMRNGKYLASITQLGNGSWQSNELLQHDDPRSAKLRKAMQHQPAGPYAGDIREQWEKALRDGHYRLLNPPERTETGWLIQGVSTGKSAPWKKGEVWFTIEDGKLADIKATITHVGSGESDTFDWELFDNGYAIYKNDRQQARSPHFEFRIDPLDDEWNTDRCYLSHYGIGEPDRKLSLSYAALAWMVALTAGLVAGVVALRRRR